MIKNKDIVIASLEAKIMNLELDLANLSTRREALADEAVIARKKLTRYDQMVEQIEYQHSRMRDINQTVYTMQRVKIPKLEQFTGAQYANEPDHSVDQELKRFLEMLSDMSTSQPSL